MQGMWSFERQAKGLKSVKIVPAEKVSATFDNGVEKYPR